MKNKTIKNLITLSVFAVLFGFAVGASAADLGDYPYTYSSRYVSPYLPYSSYAPSGDYVSYYNVTPNYSYSSYPSNSDIYNYMNKPYNYVEKPANYIEQPITREIQYIPQNTQNTQTARNTNSNINKNTNTVSNTQVASVARSTNTLNTNAATAPRTSGSGQYINFDGYNNLGASAYGVYPNVKYGNNELTALSVRGSGGFMPSSIFQWFLVVLLILAIIVIARMITKTFSKSSHGGAPAHH